MRSLLIATVMLLAACSGLDRRGAASVAMPERGWAYGDTLVLRPSVHLDSAAAPITAPLRIVVQHTNAYEWSNLWVEVTAPAGPGRVYRDTVSVPLADTYGHWLGSGFGSSYQQEITLPHSVTLTGTDSVTVRHIMRVDTLRHIERIGVALTAP